MEIKVKISDEQMKEIVKEAEDNVREELTDEAVRKYIEECNDLDVLDVFDYLGIDKKYKEINKRVSVESLSKSEKMVVLLYWIMYGVMYKWI